jgi:ubiquinone/menaquinone biosynthesis C-methylase UbiE
MTAQDYDKKTLMSWFCSVPANRKIFPLLSQIKNKKILDVGLGTGFYTRTLLQNNEIVGLDRNIHLCKLPIRLYEGDATEITKLIKDEKFDLVISMWMTDYLNPEKLIAFFTESKKVLKPGGKLMTTVISRYGFGAVYIYLARTIRKIDKYNYNKTEIKEKLKQSGFTSIEIINLTTWLKVPCAYLTVAE